MKTLMITLCILASCCLRGQGLDLGSFDPESEKIELKNQELLQSAIEDWVGRELNFGTPDFHLHPEGQSFMVVWPVAGDRISRTGMLLEITDDNRITADRIQPAGLVGGIKYTFSCEGAPCSLCDVSVRWLSWRPSVTCVCHDDDSKRSCNMNVTVEIEVGL